MLIPITDKKVLNLLCLLSPDFHLPRLIFFYKISYSSIIDLDHSVSLLDSFQRSKLYIHIGGRVRLYRGRHSW